MHVNMYLNIHIYKCRKNICIEITYTMFIMYICASVFLDIFFDDGPCHCGGRDFSRTPFFF